MGPERATSLQHCSHGNLLDLVFTIDIGQSKHIASLHYQIKNCDDILSVSTYI